MYIFSIRMHWALVDGQPIKLIKIPPWRISWHCVPGSQVRGLIRLNEWCAAWCAWAPNALADAWSASKSPALNNNLKHCHQIKIESIVHSCISLFKIYMHKIFILLFTLILIYFIKLLINTPLIYLINIFIILFFLNLSDFAYYMLY